MYYVNVASVLNIFIASMLFGLIVGSYSVDDLFNPGMSIHEVIDIAKAEVKAVDLPVIVHPSSSAISGFGGGIPVSANLKICKAIPNMVSWKLTYNYPSSVKISQY